MKLILSFFMSRKEQIYLPVLLAFLILTVSQAALAFNLCLYARSNSYPSSGHVFLTVEYDQGRVFESYGYWPKEKSPSYTMVNYTFDNPVRVIQKLNGGELSTRLKQMTEVRLCQPVNGISIAQIRATALKYPQTHGPYSVLINNCAHFAVLLYNSITGDEFPLRPTPLDTRMLIKKITDSGSSSYTQYRNLVQDYVNP